MLDLGANPLHINQDGMNMLHWCAARDTPIEVWKMFLDEGCDINYMPKDAPPDEANIAKFYLSMCQKNKRKVDQKVVQLIMDSGFNIMLCKAKIQQ